MMKRVFRKMSLKRRLWVSFVLLTVVCISATGTYVSVFFSREMETQATQASQDTINKTAQVFDERLRNIVVSVSTLMMGSTTLMMGEPFQQMLRDVQAGNRKDYYTRLSQLQTPFNQLMLIEQSIDSLLVYSPIGDFYPTEVKRNAAKKTVDTEIFKQITGEKKAWSSLWIEGHKDELFSRPYPVISFVIKPFFDTKLDDVYVIVNIREDRLQELLQAHLAEGRMKQMVINRANLPVFSSAQMPQATEELIFDKIGDNVRGHLEYEAPTGGTYLVNYVSLGMNPEWVLVGYQSKAELLAPVTRMRWTILTIMGACVVLALIMSSMLSELLLKPLFKLRNLMFKVEQNNLDVRFESVFEDEISQVGHKFNRMLEQINELIVEVKESEQDKRKSEIKALQAQIDPHFLYNTLNTIYWKSEMEEQQAVSGMIVSLSLLFRLGLNNGKELTTLGQELEHVTQYMKLQAMCYPDLFDYEVVADERILVIPVLKILLQPLVENSILHGFQDLPRRGKIEIHAAAEHGLLTLVVRDNGSGMDAEQVEKMLSGPESQRTSYALSNVQARLALYYGYKASMKFASESGVQTTVTLTIPIQEAISG
jgi:two-component system sensor histidine kinase YesM